MGRVTDHLDAATIDWISRQHLFFVGSAPSEGGHVNLSPKGLDSFRILDDLETFLLTSVSRLRKGCGPSNAASYRAMASRASAVGRRDKRACNASNPRAAAS